MAGSKMPGCLGRESMGRGGVVPARTCGPLGINDQGDPRVWSLMGDTPGALGINDYAAPAANMNLKGSLQAQRVVVTAGGKSVKIDEGADNVLRTTTACCEAGSLDFKKVGADRGDQSAQEIAQVVFTPEGFPINVEGKLNDVGDKASLIFFGIVNPLTVIEKTPTSRTLEADPDHTFRGTAKHEILKADSGHAYYKITGNGVNGESLGKGLANTVFGYLVWPVLIRSRTIPALKSRKTGRVLPAPRGGGGTFGGGGASGSW
jgi:uncharacterized membrane protein YgcG